MSIVHMPAQSGEEARPDYEAPQVVTYSYEEIIEQMGPAQAVTGVPNP